VEVLLQATDHHRFRPLPPSAAHAHDILAVAKTRDVPRQIVMDAIAAGLRPAIYGTGWEAFVDPSLIAGDYVPNRELPVLYNSARVVLSDQWDSMRDWGFVSNRLFDVLACGVPVISNAQAAVADLFEGAVLQYRTPSELRTLADGCLTSRAEAVERARRGQQIVLEEHTFDRRAAQFDDLLRGHHLV
jgi:spore maturation protein CgeB